MPTAIPASLPPEPYFCARVLQAACLHTELSPTEDGWQAIGWRTSAASPRLILGSSLGGFVNRAFVERHSWHFHEKGFPVTSALPLLIPTKIRWAGRIHELAERIINLNLCLWVPG